MGIKERLGKEVTTTMAELFLTRLIVIVFAFFAGMYVSPELKHLYKNEGLILNNSRLITHLVEHMTEIKNTQDEINKKLEGCK